MSKKFKKLLSITLACVMMVMIGVTSLTTIQTASADDGTIYLLENEDGTYSEATTIKRVINGNEVILVEEKYVDIFTGVGSQNFNLIKVTDNLFLEAEEMKISSQNENFHQELEKFNLESATKESILNSFNELEDGAIAEFVIYAPQMINTKTTTIERTTYVGYKGNTYYQELYVTDYMTRESKEIYNNRWGDASYANTEKLVLVGAFAIGAIADYFTYGAISAVDFIIELCLGDAIATKIMEAKLHQILTRKITFHEEVEGVMKMGTNVCQATDGFIEIVNHEALAGVVGTEKMYLADRCTPSWNEPQDELAYIWAAHGGMGEELPKINFGGESFG